MGFMGIGIKKKYFNFKLDNYSDFNFKNPKWPTLY